MKRINKQIQGEELFAGIDLHKLRWHVTIRTADVEIFSNSIAGRWQELRKVLNRYNGCRIHAVYMPYMKRAVLDFGCLII